MTESNQGEESLVNNTQRSSMGRKFDPWSEEEKFTVLDLVLDKIDILEGRACDRKSRNERKETWIEVGRLFEAEHGCRRSLNQIRWIWRKMKNRTIHVTRNGLQSTGGWHDIFPSPMGVSKGVQTEKRVESSDEEIDSETSSELVPENIVHKAQEPQVNNEVNIDECTDEESISETAERSLEIDEECSNEEDMLSLQEGNLLLQRRKLEEDIKEIESKRRRDAEMHHLLLKCRKTELIMMQENRERKKELFSIDLALKRRKLVALERKFYARSL